METVSLGYESGAAVSPRTIADRAIGWRIDRRVYPGSRIERLPTPLRAPALLARHYLGRSPQPPPYPWEADGLATWHYCPFKSDVQFSELYDDMIAEWYLTKEFDVRWRMWILTRLALQAKGLPGAFCEFGTYRAGCAFMVLGIASPDKFYLFDTFAGINDDRLANDETALHGQYQDTSPEYVADRLSRWSSQIELVVGSVFDTVPHATGPLAFVHMDLNAAEATGHCLEFAYERLVPGGIMVFDDYGCDTYEPQRRVVEAALRRLGGNIIALPTAQAIVIKQNP
jgi:hypothetical protein